MSEAAGTQSLELVQQLCVDLAWISWFAGHVHAQIACISGEGSKANVHVIVAQPWGFSNTLQHRNHCRNLSIDDSVESFVAIHVAWGPQRNETMVQSHYRQTIQNLPTALPENKPFVEPEISITMPRLYGGSKPSREIFPVTHPVGLPVTCPVVKASFWSCHAPLGKFILAVFVQVWVSLSQTSGADLSSIMRS